MDSEKRQFHLFADDLFRYLFPYRYKISRILWPALRKPEDPVTFDPLVAYCIIHISIHHEKNFRSIFLRNYRNVMKNKRSHAEFCAKYATRLYHENKSNIFLAVIHIAAMILDLGVFCHVHGRVRYKFYGGVNLATICEYLLSEDFFNQGGFHSLTNYAYTYLITNLESILMPEEVNSEEPSEEVFKRDLLSLATELGAESNKMSVEEIKNIFQDTSCNPEPITLQSEEAGVSKAATLSESSCGTENTSDRIFYEDEITISEEEEDTDLNTTVANIIESLDLNISVSNDAVDIPQHQEDIVDMMNKTNSHDQLSMAEVQSEKKMSTVFNIEKSSLKKSFDMSKKYSRNKDCNVKDADISKMKDAVSTEETIFEKDLMGWHTIDINFVTKPHNRNGTGDGVLPNICPTPFQSKVTPESEVYVSNTKGENITSISESMTPEIKEKLKNLYNIYYKSSDKVGHPSCMQNSEGSNFKEQEASKEETDKVDGNKESQLTKTKEEIHTKREEF